MATVPAALSIPPVVPTVVCIPPWLPELLVDAVAPELLSRPDCGDEAAGVDPLRELLPALPALAVLEDEELGDALEDDEREEELELLGMLGLEDAVLLEDEELDEELELDDEELEGMVGIDDWEDC